jgi:hypothetical protein
MARMIARLAIHEGSSPSGTTQFGVEALMVKYPALTRTNSDRYRAAPPNYLHVA